MEIVREGGEFQAVAFAPQSFARTVRATADNPAETAYINAVLADKPLGYWPLNEPANARQFLDRSGNGFHGYAMNKVLAGQPGPLPGNSRAVALDGDGNIDVGRHDEFALVNDFTVEAWVCMGRIPPQPYGNLIAANPDTGATDPRMFGWALEASLTEPQIRPRLPHKSVSATYAVKNYRFAIPRTAMAADQWLHVAVVCDRDNTAHLYLNGQYQESIDAEQARQSRAGVDRDRRWADIRRVLARSFGASRGLPAGLEPTADTESLQPETGKPERHH